LKEITSSNLSMLSFSYNKFCPRHFWSALVQPVKYGSITYQI
jgi:hypothetical protein